MMPSKRTWQFLSTFSRLGRHGPSYVISRDLDGRLEVRAYGPSRGGHQ